jgi:hypothetical protein
VVATRASVSFDGSGGALAEPFAPVRVFAVQNIQELKNEYSVYRSALALTKQLAEPKFDYDSAQLLIREIGSGIVDWPAQWEREKQQRRNQPFWNLSANSLKRINEMSFASRDGLLSPMVDSRIVLCELVNSFPATVFPNPLEMHNSILYGIRPLLYTILRRQFVAPRDLANCANTQCKNFFNIDRAGQQFCSLGCSRHQRQRIYWEQRGKKMRNKRLKNKRIGEKLTKSGR